MTDHDGTERGETGPDPEALLVERLGMLGSSRSAAPGSPELVGLMARLGREVRATDTGGGGLAPFGLAAASALGVALPSPASAPLGAGAGELALRCADALRGVELQAGEPRARRSEPPPSDGR